MNIPHIANLISELLHTNDCVTIPEFGAFVSNQVGAKLDANKHHISPPGPQLSFNRKIVANDGLLANFLANKEGITYSQAVEKLARLAAFIQQELADKKTFDFNVLGGFHLAPGNIIKFEPGTGNPNFDLGLHPITLTPLAEEAWAEKQALGASETTTPRVVPNPTTASTPWKKVAAAIIALPILGYLVWLPSQTHLLDKDHNFNAGELNPFGKSPGQQYHVRAIPGIDSANWESIADEYTQEVPAINEVPEKAENKTPMDTHEDHSASASTGYQYQLIGGCFSEEANAKKLIATMQQNGIDAFELDVYKGLHRVSLGGYDSEREARAALRQLKQSHHSNAWILKQ